jgi:lysophospholipase L1-like esterase
MAPARQRSKWFLFFGAILVVPVLLLLAEGATRLFAGRIDPLAIFVTSPQLRSDTQGEATSGLFEFDPHLTWRLKANLPLTWWDFTPVKTNNAHVRMDGDIGAKRGLRILCLGDSVTFGYRVPVAHERSRPEQFDAAERTYPQLLGELLRARYPGTDIEVIPLACPGYTSGQGRAWLEREIGALQPDLITACFGWNDIRAAGLPDRLTFPASTGQVRVRKLMAHSQLLLHLARSAQSARATDLLPTHAEPRTSAEEYTANFAAMGEAAKRHGAWFGILLPVYRDANTPGDYPETPAHPGDPEEGKRMADYRNDLQRHAKANSLPALLVPELTEMGWPANKDLFGERIHPNAAGHRLLAERVTEFLVPAAETILKARR